MNFNNLKRRFFFWIEKLQISKNERIAFTVLLVVLAVIFSLSLFVQKTYNFSQERYNEITAEFEKRSALIKQQEKEQEQKYNPTLTVTDSETSDNEEPVVQPEQEEIKASTEKININTATSTDLQSLKGIGEVYARRIIEYRVQNGGFDSINELVNVKGIGEKRLENIRPYITLEDSTKTPH